MILFSFKDIFVLLSCKESNLLRNLASSISCLQLSFYFQLRWRQRYSATSYFSYFTNIVRATIVSISGPGGTGGHLNYFCVCWKAKSWLSVNKKWHLWHPLNWNIIPASFLSMPPLHLFEMDFWECASAQKTFYIYWKALLKPINFNECLLNFNAFLKYFCKLFSRNGHEWYKNVCILSIFMDISELSVKNDA